MKGDVSRGTFNAAKHFIGVLLQQGRVQLDADYNEGLAILNYLAQNPNAQDTLEGIIQWWLLENQRAAAGRVKKLINGLVRQRLLAHTQRADGRMYYRLNCGKISAPGKHLRKTQKQKRKKP
jgi:hypothetical protein